MSNAKEILDDLRKIRDQLDEKLENLSDEEFERFLDEKTRDAMAKITALPPNGPPSPTVAEF